MGSRRQASPSTPWRWSDSKEVLACLPMSRFESCCTTRSKQIVGPKLPASEISESHPAVLISRKRLFLLLFLLLTYYNNSCFLRWLTTLHPYSSFAYYRRQEQLSSSQQQHCHLREDEGLQHPRLSATTSSYHQHTPTIARGNANLQHLRLSTTT